MKAGLPTTVQFAGTLFVRIVPAPITTLSPMVMSPTTTALQLIVTLLPIVGRPFPFLPTVTQCFIEIPPLMN